MALRLYTYWRSSAAYRVRIALALKDLDYQSVPRHLLRDGGEHRRADYLALNPQGLVPALEHDGAVITQSLAICEYLEEVFPRPALLPPGPVVADAGFDEWVRAAWEPLSGGQPQSMQFLVPSRLRTYRFEVSPVEAGTPDLRAFRLQLGGWLGWLASEPMARPTIRPTTPAATASPLSRSRR